VKLALEDARYGRPALKSLDWYCGACATELNIEPAPPPAPRQSGRLSARSPSPWSGRLAPARDLVPRPVPLAGEGRPALAAAVTSIAATLLAVGAILLWVGRGDSASHPAGAAPAAPARAEPRPAVSPAAAASHAEQQPPRPLPPQADRAVEAPSAGERTGPVSGSALLSTETLVGNRSSRKYHLATCKYASGMKESNRVPLASREEARRLQFEPCRECLGKD
jgi:hypothetical protein